MTSIWQAIYIGGLSIAFFLFIMIISKRQKTAADKILGAWFFFAVIHLAFIAWYASGLAFEIPTLIIWQLPFPFLHGPFLYLYILFLSGQQRYRWLYLLHYIPAVLVVLILSCILPDIFVPGQVGRVILSEFQPIFQGIVVGITISGIVYVLLSLRLLGRHRRNIVGQLSNTDKITLNWIRYLILGMSTIWVVVIFVNSPQALYVVVALFIFFIGYFGIRQVGVFSNVIPIHEVVPSAMLRTPLEGLKDGDVITAEKVKYEKNRLEENESKRIHAELSTLMKKQECYKDPELTLGDLAKKLNVHPAILSQIINTKEAKSFYDYVNSFRVEAFKALLLKPESGQYTMLALAFECGFNSKTSFNRNFKKITAMSPSAYAKKLQIKLQVTDRT